MSKIAQTNQGGRVCDRDPGRIFFSGARVIDPAFEAFIDFFSFLFLWELLDHYHSKKKLFTSK